MVLLQATFLGVASGRTLNKWFQYLSYPGNSSCTCKSTAGETRILRIQNPSNTVDFGHLLHLYEQVL